MPNLHRLISLSVVLVGTISVFGIEASVLLAGVVSPRTRHELRYHDVLLTQIGPQAAAGHHLKPSTSSRSPYVAITWGVTDLETMNAVFRVRLVSRLVGHPGAVVPASSNGDDAIQIVEQMRNDVVGHRPDSVVFDGRIDDVHRAQIRTIGDADPCSMRKREPVARARDLVAHRASRFADRGQHRCRAPHLLSIAYDLCTRDVLGMPVLCAVHWIRADGSERNVRRSVDISQRHGTAVMVGPQSALRARRAPAGDTAISYLAVDTRTTADDAGTLPMRLARIAEDLRASDSAILRVRPIAPAEAILEVTHRNPVGNAEVTETRAGATRTLLARRVAAEVD